MSLEEHLATRDFEQIPLKVTSGVLLHIGAGIYNSVAGAIKELVSNSFDADATRVVISMDYPWFREIKVVDNGLGMTQVYFRKAMESIGSTLKGTVLAGRLTPKFGRPMIGHLGIGLMALTQVCDEATIESQVPGSDTKFVATLDFSEFKERKRKQMEAVKLDVFRDFATQYGGIDGMRRELERLGPESEDYSYILAQLELATQAEEMYEQREEEDLEREHLGYCVMYYGIPAVPSEHGSTITLKKIDQGVRASLMDVGRSRDAMPKHYRERGLDWHDYRDEVNGWSWRDLCERLRLRTGHLVYQSLSKYHHFLWELSITTPVRYLEGGPVLVETELLRWKREQIDDFGFSVLVDNRLLQKPTLLPSGDVARKAKLEPEYDYHVEEFETDTIVDRERLKYGGYIFWQRRQIQPSALRGIQIYIRNVGIGVYDQTLMGFSTVNPTSRAGQMSGEIHVEEGLERALNVDRNSFRETDAHYIALQEHLWKLLGSATRGDGVMGTSVEAYWKRKKRAEEQALKEHVKELRQLARGASGGRLALRFSDRESREPYSVGAKTITVYDRSPRWPRSASDRRLHQRLLIAARVAIAVGSSAEQVLALLERILLER